MKACCRDFYSIRHSKINISKSYACCLAILIEKYDESLKFNTQKYFADFLFNTLNHYLKKNNFKISKENKIFDKDDEIKISQFIKFINILSHYSSIFYLHKKYDYTKLFLSVGVEVINMSKYRILKNICKKKFALVSNIGCVYIKKKILKKQNLFSINV